MSVLAFVNGSLVDGTGREPGQGWGLVVAGSQIQQVGPTPELKIPEGAQVYDVGGATIMPGLIDCHTHLTYHSTHASAFTIELEESVELNTIKATVNARRILETGVTAIGDGACRGNIGAAIRDGIKQGLIVGPKVVAAGPALCGDAGLLDSMPPWVKYESDVALGMVVNGVEEVRRAVRRQVKAGVDWIKVAASGVAGSKFTNAETQDLVYDEILAAVTEAAKFGKPVHAHAHDKQGVKDSIRAGVISLHSGEFIDDEGLSMLIDHDCIFSPTIAWLHYRTFDEYPMALYPDFLDEATRAYEAAAEAIVKARQRGAKVAMGSDAAHRFPPFSLVKEMEYFADLGYTPPEIIVASTKIAAEAINRADQYGTLEPGKAADVLIVQQDPNRDVRALWGPKWIVRDGQPYGAAPEWIATPEAAGSAQ
ncbi:MAG: amidohydrolase family protein [Chloroflexi bacterium]|nr:amidohydrolase family protein [Chloroflexota bacterium]